MITDSYEYDAFGNLIAKTGTTPNNYLYRGEQWDPDLSLYYLRARYYNPVTGRFLSQDPYAGDTYDPPSLHRYRYASGNPVNYIDPSGRGALAEFAFNVGLKYGEEVAGLVALASEIACVYYAEASAIHLVNYWMELSQLQQGIGLVSLTLQVGACAATAEFTEGPEPGFCSLCFAAGTLVHTDHGNVPIEKIAVGDRVLSRNRQTGETELRPVTALTPPHRDKLLELRIEGEKAVLRPSLHHPFWVKRSAEASGHWIEAVNLVPGELLETTGGKWLKIERVIPVKNRETVYNFTVGENHDYFVGETGFLVHNAGPQLPKNWIPFTNPPQMPPQIPSDGYNRIRPGGPKPGYPNGYWRWERFDPNTGGWQGIDPFTGLPGNYGETHVEYPPGMCPLP
jgi:RHS repeat-associated protein